MLERQKKFYNKGIRIFEQSGKQLNRLTERQRQRIREQKAAILNRPPPPVFYAASGVAQEDSPWIFRLATQRSGFDRRLAKLQGSKTVPKLSAASREPLLSTKIGPCSSLH